MIITAKRLKTCIDALPDPESMRPGYRLIFPSIEVRLDFVVQRNDDFRHEWVLELPDPEKPKRKRKQSQ